MQQHSVHEPGDDQLKADNDFLKMKLMLERGAEFSVINGSRTVSPAEENKFLRSIIEYEAEAEQHGSIPIYDKIGRPTQFKPVSSIPDQDMMTAWKELCKYLHQQQISIGVCSPNVSIRELYRFVTEELFNLPITRMDMRGFMHGFVYDEFHPDPVFENTRAALDGCLRPLFSNGTFEWAHFLSKKPLRLNGHYPLTRQEFANLVNHFKQPFQDFRKVELTHVHCTVNERGSYVNGHYEVLAVTKMGENQLLEGGWLVEFIFDEDAGYWDIGAFHIEGIEI